MQGSQTVSPSKVAHPSVRKKGREGEASWGPECSLFSQLGKALRRWPWEPRGLGVGEGQPIRTGQGG